MAYGKLSEQLQSVSAEVDAVVGSGEVARAAERHATAEAEVLKAQADAEQVAALFFHLFFLSELEEEEPSLAPCV